MTDCADTSGLLPHAAVLTPPPVPCNLLLVSGDKRWTRAVREAAAEIGGGVSSCDARHAVIRLACLAPHYSHLLLHPDSADGLLNELVTLTAGDRESDTEMLLLGNQGPLPPRIGVIHSADRRAVRQALAPRPPQARAPDENPMHLTELREALAGAMIETRYQPIVRLADREPVALEALARLNHPTRGTVLPDAFVPQIEDAGLAAQLTDLVAERALADMAGPLLRARGLDITLNFPLGVLLVPAALQRLDVMRRAAGLAAERVVIELTESRPVDDLVGLGGVLEKLRADGYRVSIDDVSPAVPHVARLLELPFTCLKLDKAVVRHLPGVPMLQDFVRQVMAVARARHLSVVAEGVEDLATWRRMEVLGVDHAQGFLVARPLPAAAVPIWLEAWRSQPEFR
ncbi:MAG: EAL domain-containing protein [Acetobacteraceae bacterium]|jgi:EAL domain-containing protein (putative c-di-GMP-specific phosphodiesterase class I)